jgi:hypothetical protein
MNDFLFRMVVINFLILYFREEKEKFVCYSMKVGVAQDIVLFGGRFVIVQFDSDKSHKIDDGEYAEKSKYLR